MDDDRDLFLLLCSGLLETYCSQVVFDGVRFGVTASVVPSRGTGPRIVLDFSETEFETAIVVTEESAQSLWPDRPPRRRSVQLMLVHADEDIATTPAAPDAYVMTLPDGHVVVRPVPPSSPAARAAARRLAEDQAAERARLRRVVDEGKRDGHSFEWR